MAVAKKSDSLPVSFHGEGGTLFGIHLVNLFLTILTLGIYHFWAKVKLRNYLWGQFEIAGDRFAFHGTALEILKGWLKAAAIFGVPYLLLRMIPEWMGLGVAAQVAGALLATVLLLIFIPIAMVGSRKYRLSRSSWRGIRFSFRGKVREFAGIFFKSMLFMALTLGFYSPYWTAARQRFMQRNSYFGGKKFGYDGKGEDLFGSYAIAVLLCLPTLFFSLIWYEVKSGVYNWSHTTLGKARFRSTVTFGSMLGMAFTNILLVLFTLGFGASWAEARYYRFVAENLFLDGDAELDDVEQDAKASEATGEEMADFLDMDFDLG